MAAHKKLFMLAAVLIVLGIGSIFLQPGGPETQCATRNVTSGYYDEEKNCPISVESMREVSDYIGSPKIFRIVGVVLCAGGLVVGIAGVVKVSRARKRAAR